METIVIQIFVVLSSLLALAGAYIGYKCFLRKTETARALGYTIAAATLLVVAYLFSVLSNNILTASIMTSTYFAGIDWMLTFLAMFVSLFTNLKRSKGTAILSWFILLYSCLETVIFAINPFFPIAATYLDTGRTYARFRFQMLPLLQLHLTFSYVIIIFVLYALIRRLLKAPRQYRNQFLFILLGIVLVVAVNATFLYLPENSPLTVVDYSLCMYPLVILLIYWDSFHYTEHQMLRGLSLTVFENIGQGIVLFDYEGRLVMKNARAEALLSTVEFAEKMPVETFLTQCSIPVKVAGFAKPYSLQCYIEKDQAERTLRCDYRPLKDKSGHLVSTLYVFTDAELETDLLTGFHKWPYFKRFAAERPNTVHRLAAAIFDINALAVINNTRGIAEGDRQIRELARSIRKNFPPESYFVRGHDANLLAVCFDQSEQQMIRQAEAVAREFQGDLQYAVSVPKDDGNNVLDSIDEASQALQVKKLLDQNSQNSQVVTSLVRALKECDSDTEAHVQRTQKLGDELACRLNLSDAQRSNLRLLCLLHDIGKIGIPLDILNKPGKLTADEWEVVRSHAEKGYQIAMSSEKLSSIADMILHHHERWDGKGYPSGLSRESIPLLSRVIALVDAYDAMVNNRKYRKAMSVSQALQEIRRCAGSQFDPYIASAFIQMLQEQEGISDIPAEVPASDAPTPTSTAAGSSFRENDHVFVVHYSKYLLDDNDVIVDVDSTFSEITGYTADEVLHSRMTQLDLIPPEDRTEYIATVSASLAKSSTIYLEHKLQRKDGSSLYVFCFAEKIFDATAMAARTKIIISDIYNAYSMKIMVKAENMRAMQRLKYWEDVYRSDSLTGLLTHAAFRNDVQQKLLEGDARVVMLSLDVDRFKAYNDQFGHVAGDELLTVLAQALRSACEEADLVCRMGGDEFAVAIFAQHDAPNSAIVQNVHRIYDRVAMSLQTFRSDAGISMGCAVSGPECSTFKQLYTAADGALYRSKDSGRGKLTFTADLLTKA